LSIDGPVENVRAALEGEIEQLIARQYNLRPLKEGEQQTILSSRELMRYAVMIDQFALCELQRPAIEAQDFAGWRFDVRRQRVRATEHRIDARHKFARVERFHHVIVGADFEPDNAVEFFGPRREQNDRNVVGFTNVTAK
jgi:hypothetical protein